MSFLDSKWYFLLIFAGIMPMNGCLIAKGYVLEGAALILTQVLWVISNVLPRWQDIK
jgi:hypothetical protein